MANEKLTEASVLTLIEKNTITASRGAELSGISLWDFLDLMYANGLSLWDDTPEELEQDLRELRSVRKTLRQAAEMP